MAGWRPRLGQDRVRVWLRVAILDEIDGYGSEKNGASAEWFQG